MNAGLPTQILIVPNYHVVGVLHGSWILRYMNTEFLSDTVIAFCWVFPKLRASLGHNG